MTKAPGTMSLDEIEAELKELGAPTEGLPAPGPNFHRICSLNFSRSAKKIEAERKARDGAE